MGDIHSKATNKLMFYFFYNNLYIQSLKAFLLSIAITVIDFSAYKHKGFQYNDKC